MIEFRKCLERDLEDIYEHHFQAMLESNCHLDGHGLPEDLEDIQGHYFDRQGTFVVAVHGSEVVGMGGLCVVEPLMYEVRHLYIQKSFRGQQFGFDLLQYLLNSSIVSEKHKVCAHTLECMHEAQGLLRRSGFKVIAKYMRGSDEWAYFLK